MEMRQGAGMKENSAPSFSSFRVGGMGKERTGKDKHHKQTTEQPNKLTSDRKYIARRGGKHVEHPARRGRKKNPC